MRTLNLENNVNIDSTIYVYLVHIYESQCEHWETFLLAVSHQEVYKRSQKGCS
jgi:hypothetical protein